MATANAMFTITDVGDLNGRNLVLNSHEEHSRTVPSSGANGVVPYYSYSDFASEFTHTKGQILTVSFDYETTGNTLSTGLIYVQHNESQIAPTAGSVIVNILDNPSGHYSKTFKVTANQSTSTKNTIRVYYKTCSPGTVIKIKNVKVETGDEETPWTPAPEDVVTAMETANTAKTTAESKNSVYYQSTTPTAHKVGDTWFDTANDYKIRRWNGSTWAAAELGDSAVANLSASKLIAGSVMGNVILGGTIQAGGSDAGQDGKVLVKDVNDTEVASLSKDGLVATAGNVGGWNIGEKTLESDHVTGVDESGIEHTGKSTLDVEGGLKIVGSSTTVFAPDVYQRGWRPPTVSLWGESTIGPRNISSEYLVAKDKTVSNGGFWIPGRNISAWYTLTPRKQIANTGIYFTLYTKGDLSLFWLILDGETPEWTAGVKNNVATSLVDYVDSPTAHFINSVRRSQVAPPYTIWLVNSRGAGSTAGRGGVCNNYGQEIQPYISMDGYINIYAATTSTGVAAITANVFWAHIDYPYTES